MAFDNNGIEADGFLASRADGSVFPALRTRHLNNIRQAAKHPEMAADPEYPAIFRKMEDPDRYSLSKKEIQLLHLIKQHPDFVGDLRDSIEAAAALYAQALRENAKAAAYRRKTHAADKAHSRRQVRALTPGEIKRDIEQVLGTSYARAPRSSKRRGSR